MIFFLFRHGSSLANEADLVTGTPIDELSASGLLQAQRMRSWILDSGIQADRYYVSHWRRARQTAEALFKDVCWQEDKRLGETDAGEVANWSRKDFLKAQPEFGTNPNLCYPKGESHHALNKRVLRWLGEQLEDPCDAVAVTAHSGPISCLIQHVTSINMDYFPTYLPAHCSLSVLDIDPKRASQGKLLGFSIGPVENLPFFFKNTR